MTKIVYLCTTHGDSYTYTWVCRLQFADQLSLYLLSYNCACILIQRERSADEESFYLLHQHRNYVRVGPLKFKLNRVQVVFKSAGFQILPTLLGNLPITPYSTCKSHKLLAFIWNLVYSTCTWWLWIPLYLYLFIIVLSSPNTKLPTCSRPAHWLNYNLSLECTLCSNVPN